MILQREDDVVEKLRSYDKILTENVDIRLKLKAAELEREQYKIDIAKVAIIELLLC